MVVYSSTGCPILCEIVIIKTEGYFYSIKRNIIENPKYIQVNLWYFEHLTADIMKNMTLIF